MNVIFDIYLNLNERNIISRLVIDNFQSYLSFTMINNVLFASTLSILNGTHEFTKVSFKIINVKNKRKTKYTPSITQQKDISLFIGPRSRKALLSRINLTNTTNQHHIQYLYIQNNLFIVPFLGSSHDIPL